MQARTEGRDESKTLGNLNGSPIGPPESVEYRWALPNPRNSLPIPYGSRGMHSRLALMLASAVVTLALVACASVSPEPDMGFKSRATSRTYGHVTVSTSVLSANESRSLYGVPLASKGVQPVWIRVENHDEVAYWLLSPGVDPNFFPASEAADAFEFRPQDDSLERRFRELAFHNPIPPGATVSGFILTNLDQGVKMVQVDLVASGRLRAFSLLNTIPGFRADYRSTAIFRRNPYDPSDVKDYVNESDFRTALEALPCCATNEKGTRKGDPLNLVIVGGLEDAFPALARRGWRPTEATWFGSVIKMMTSALSGDRYPYAPVSPLYIYQRRQDLALQKTRDNVHQRNHLRLWLSPMHYRGKPVWVGQISRDIGTRLTIHSPFLTTHKIDPDVDEARTALVEDMAYSQNLAAIGFVKGVGSAPKRAPRENLTEDPYYTDGLRAVLIFDARPTSPAQIDFLPWERLGGRFIRQTVRGLPR